MSGLNTPVKEVIQGIKKCDPTICCLQETPSNIMI